MKICWSISLGYLGGFIRHFSVCGCAIGAKVYSKGENGGIKHKKFKVNIGFMG